MLIAHLTFNVDKSKRNLALAALTVQSDKVRAMKGCLAYVPFTDPTNETSIGVLHEWENESDFTAYNNSDVFDEMRKLLRPLMTAPPKSKRFDATLKETVN